MFQTFYMISYDFIARFGLKLSLKKTSRIIICHNFLIFNIKHTFIINSQILPVQEKKREGRFKI